MKTIFSFLVMIFASAIVLAEPVKIGIPSGYIYARIYGSGSTAVILTHGGPGGCGWAASLAKLLQQEFLVVEMFQRECAASQTSDSFTIDDYVSDYAAVVKFTTLLPGVKKTVLVGTSWSAFPVLQFSKTPDAQLLAKAILLSPVYMTAEGTNAFYKKMFWEMTKKRPWYAAKLSYYLVRSNTKDPVQFNKYFRLSLRTMTIPYFDDPEYSASQLHFEDVKPTTGNENLMSYLEKMKNENLAKNLFLSDLDKISVPVVLMKGTQDPIPHTEVEMATLATIPNYRYVEFFGNHSPWLNKASVDSFLDQFKLELSR